jgi:hypothetical protein
MSKTLELNSEKSQKALEKERKKQNRRSYNPISSYGKKSSSSAQLTTPTTTDSPRTTGLFNILHYLIN